VKDISREPYSKPTNTNFKYHFNFNICVQFICAALPVVERSDTSGNETLCPLMPKASQLVAGG
jgi:hypothetical protein